MTESTRETPHRELPARVTLCTGKAVSLSEAALNLTRLEDLAHGDTAAREELFYLRQTALGRFIPEDVRVRLIREGSLDETGNVAPATGDVIEAAVRGTERALTVDPNPFVYDWDRTLVDLARCQERVRTKLTKELAEQVLQQVPHVRADLGDPHRLRSPDRLLDWSDQVKANRKLFENRREAGI